jgi:hypothetical protein
MAITLTKNTIQARVNPAVDLSSEIVNETKPSILVLYNEVFDDPNDNNLPVSVNSQKMFYCTDDVSGEAALVQTIATAIWS